MEQSFKQYLNEYDTFCIALDELNSNSLNEWSLPSFIKDKIDFVKNIANQLGTSIDSLVALFKNKEVFKFFSKIDWSLENLFKILKKGYVLYKEVQEVVFGYISKLGPFKHTGELLSTVDEWLLNHPKLKHVAGIAVAGLLTYAWFKCSMTGDPLTDFDMSDIISAFTGHFSLEDLFTGPGGVKLITLLVAGTLTGGFPWPSVDNVKFVGALVATLAVKVGVKYTKHKPTEQEV